MLPPFKLERYFARYEFKADYLLCSSDCESMTVGELLDLEPDARQRFETHWLGYTESPGAPALRAQISRIYDTIEAHQVLVHTGAQEAILLFMQAALKTGDHIIVHSPCYQSLAEVARSLGCRVSAWHADPRADWALDLEALREAICPATRVVVVNLPHNPTGYLMPRAEYEELLAVIRRHGLILFADEVYREVEYRPADRLPAACDMDERAVSLGVLSKSYSLPGLRIGWVATRNAKILNAMAGLKDYTTICNSAPSEFLAELALRHRHVLTGRSRQIIAGNLQVLDDFFDRHADRFAWRRPLAGPIAFPRLVSGAVERFCRALVSGAGVLLLPGTVYGDYDDRFRIGCGRRNLPEAVARLEAFLHSRQN